MPSLRGMHLPDSRYTCCYRSPYTDTLTPDRSGASPREVPGARGPYPWLACRDCDPLVPTGQPCLVTALR